MEVLHSKLSDRQVQCLELVNEGLTSKEIARELGLSPSTIDNHIGSAVRQLGCANRQEAAKQVMRNKSPQQFTPSATVQIKLLDILKPPPVGGQINSDPIPQRIVQIILIMLLGTLASALTVLTIIGVVRILSG